MTMLLMVAVTAALAVLVTISAWPALRDSKADPGSPKDRGMPGGRLVVHTPESLEAVLLGQLLAAEINRRQYRHAMAALAARDADRHPMSVPRDGASSDGSDEGLS